MNEEPAVILFIQVNVDLVVDVSLEEIDHLSPF
ncbi:hypothetical protein PC116_g20493 [Phytophthora cactorum]|nr:hypothetical protein PC116_g20493 [Phytophthora cactorum]